MKLYNTLSRKVEELKPVNSGQVKLYTCGPTVYHYAHIGNLRNVIFNDTLRRALEISGYKVSHVMNITDVGHLASDADEGEDKLEKGAARESKTVWEVADYYIEAFYRHAKALNVLSPSKTIRATETIQPQIELTEKLLNKGYAYQTKQAIYFDTAKLDDYGKLSGQKLADKEIAVRSEVVTDPDKHHPQDFALWFFTVGHFSDHQMRWATPFGEGFPGWHLECSSIIHQELGETIDIHTGGVDHVGTHHTNEIAQSEAAFDKPLANIWLHNEFLRQDGGKMSKSAGQIITLDEVIKKGYDPLALRLFYLQSHYRSHADFSWQNLDAAQNRLINWRNIAALRWQAVDKKTDNHADDIATVESAIHSPLFDNLNTAQVLVNVDHRFNELSKKLIYKDGLEAFAEYLRSIDQALGTDLESIPDVNDNQKRLIFDREESRKNKNWPKSDELRARLKEQGIGLRDNPPNGAIWYRLWQEF